MCKILLNLLNVYDLLSLGPIVNILYFLGEKRRRASVLFIVIFEVHTNFTVLNNKITSKEFVKGLNYFYIKKNFTSMWTITFSAI